MTFHINGINFILREIAIDFKRGNSFPDNHRFYQKTNNCAYCHESTVYCHDISVAEETICMKVDEINQIFDVFVSL